MRFLGARRHHRMSMSHHEADDSTNLPADTTSARWVGYKVVGGGNEYDLLERAGVRAIQLSSSHAPLDSWRNRNG
jgi:hypothetical protein